MVKIKVKRTNWVKKNGKVHTQCNNHAICHEDCSLGHDNDLYTCCVFEANRCIKCGCAVSQHRHDGWEPAHYEEDIVDPVKLKDYETAEDRKKQSER